MPRVACVTLLALLTPAQEAASCDSSPRLFLRVRVPLHFVGATASTDADGRLAVAGTHRLSAAIDGETFELCLPSKTLPNTLTVAWSPRLRQTFALAGRHLATGVMREPDGALRIELEVASGAVVLAATGETGRDPVGAVAGRFGGRAGGRAAAPQALGVHQSLERAFVWLGDRQQPDGSWPGSGTAGECLPTAAASLALLGRGSTLKSGPNAHALRRAVAWLVEATDARTGRVRVPSADAPIEEQALVTVALSEAYGLSKFEPLHDSVLATVDALERMLEDPTTSDRRDACAIALASFALVSAKEFRIARTNEALARATAELDGGDEVAPLRDAASLIVGSFIDDPRLSATDRRAPNLLANLPARGATLDAAYVYFGTHAMRRAGAPYWAPWAEAIEESLVASQVVAGEFAGSWAPGDPRAEMRGRCWTTAMRVLTIQAFAR